MVTNLISKNYSKNKFLNRESMSKYLYLYFTDVQIPNHGSTSIGAVKGFKSGEIWG